MHSVLPSFGSLFTAAGIAEPAPGLRHPGTDTSNGTRDVVKVGRNQAALHGGLTKLLAHVGGVGQLPPLPKEENAVKNEVHLGQNQEVLRACIVQILEALGAQGTVRIVWFWFILVPGK